MSHTTEKTLFMWEKGRGDKCRPGPKSCLPHARPVNLLITGAKLTDGSLTWKLNDISQTRPSLTRG